MARLTLLLSLIVGCGGSPPAPTATPVVDPESDQELEAREMGRTPPPPPPARPVVASGAAEDVAASVPGGEFTAFDGSRIDLAEVTRSGGAVVVFYRGHWCKECREQLRELESVRVPLGQQGYSVYAISTDDPATSAELRRRLGLGFSLLSDPGGLSIAAWGVYTAEHDLARPAVFIVAPGGRIIFRYVSDSPADRPKAQDLLKRVTSG